MNLTKNIAEYQVHVPEKMEILIRHLAKGNMGTIGKLCRDLKTCKRTVSKNIILLRNMGVVKTNEDEKFINEYLMSFEYCGCSPEEICKLVSEIKGS
ncbi:hypothetical protein COU58_02680 [Candidatus Pacearchaeota archaeon CG10_big_fil_rev_8_21_14_0_10_32_42]|nr:MAG: hypothetical protein COU58_02680 [Candidatus Pacearchaeota archaeon CG10_big_fil_rev_8_21_14_0_10_32_42]